MTFDEEFRDFPFNQSIQVSQYGRVRTKDGKIIQQINLKNYLVIEVENYKYPIERVHRLVALTWLPDGYKKGFHVHHIDRDFNNNRVDNLMWCECGEHMLLGHGWQLDDESMRKYNHAI